MKRPSILIIMWKGWIFRGPHLLVSVFVCVWYARLINTSLHVRATLQNSNVGSTHVHTHGLHSYWGDCYDQRPSTAFFYLQIKLHQLFHNTPVMNTRAAVELMLVCKESVLTMFLTNDKLTLCLWSQVVVFLFRFNKVFGVFFGTSISHRACF